MNSLEQKWFFYKMPFAFKSSANDVHREFLEISTWVTNETSISQWYEICRSHKNEIGCTHAGINWDPYDAFLWSWRNALLWCQFVLVWMQQNSIFGSPYNRLYLSANYFAKCTTNLLCNMIAIGITWLILQPSSMECYF